MHAPVQLHCEVLTQILSDIASEAAAHHKIVVRAIVRAHLVVHSATGQIPLLFQCCRSPAWVHARVINKSASDSDTY